MGQLDVLNRVNKQQAISNPVLLVNTLCPESRECDFIKVGQTSPLQRASVTQACTVVLRQETVTVATKAM